MAQFQDDSANTNLARLRADAEERVAEAMANQFGIPYIDLHGYTINPEAIKIIPESDARRLNIAAFTITRQQLSIAVHNPNDYGVSQYITTLKERGYTPQLFVTSMTSLEHVWVRYADIKTTTATKRGILDINPDVILTFSESIKTIKDVEAQLLNIRTLNSPRRISETLEVTFAGALALKASDIHIEPSEQAIRLRYRLDGVLVDVFQYERHIYGRMLSRLKLLSGMILNQRLEAQDGRFQFTFGEREIEVRSSVIPGASGESMVMRLLDPGVASFSFDKLALNDKLREVMIEQLKRPNGLIVTTGPTGSGKTTALYAFLRAVHESEKKIITIENPVEYKLEGIVQTQVGPDYSFADGLRAILRQDPDIIMVGEIRDHEVAETAIHAAQTGHLVFSTLHTNSAIGGFPRLMDLGIDNHIMGSAVNIMIGQRLVRVLCPDCKQTYTATKEEEEILTRLAQTYPDGFTIPNPITLYKAIGCAACGQTGYQGRLGVFEAVVVDDAVEEAIIRDPREHTIREAARNQKIPTMAEDGMAKVIHGVTSFMELERVVDLSEAKGVAPLTSRTTDATETDSDDDFLSHVV